jgi:hypothetical protein
VIRLTVDTDRLKRLIEARRGGVRGLMDVWAERFDQVPDRSTFYNWLVRDRFAGSFGSYLRLCGCLDVDPVALVSLEGLNGCNPAESLLHKALGGVGGRGITAGDVVGLFGPMTVWPASPVVRAAFGRDWFRAEFKNEGGQDAYRAVRITFPDAARPRLLHFAYRGRPARLWRIYGFVQRDATETRLVNHFGPPRRCAEQPPAAVIVETYFGRGACDFCVASLHPFALEFLPHAADQPVLRFDA